MLLKSVTFLCIIMLILTLQNAYAQDKTTIRGCFDPGGTMGVQYFFINDNSPNNEKYYEIASEEIDDKTGSNLYDKCSCSHDKICDVTIIYTTDKEDYDTSDALGLIRKFTSIHEK